MNNFGKRLLTIIIGMLIATVLIAAILYFLNRTFFEKKPEGLTSEKSGIIIPAAANPETTGTTEILAPGGIEGTPDYNNDNGISEENNTPPDETVLTAGLTSPDGFTADDSVPVKSAPPARAKNDTIGNLIQNINAGKTAKRAGDIKKYKLQAGSYQTGADAERQKGRLAMLNIAAQVVKVTLRGKDYYRVITIKPLTPDEAKSLRDNLKNKNIDSFIITP